MFAMHQHLAPEDRNDKCGHFYTICLNLKNQQFELLDSAHDDSDASLRSHYEYFIGRVKETWKEHYGQSKVHISNYPTQYIVMPPKSDPCTVIIHARYTTKIRDSR